MMAAITLKNANVNSGTAVTISGNIVSYGMKRIIGGTPTEGYYDSGDTNYWEIATKHRGGIENPIIVISGSIDADETLAAHEMTEALLRHFHRERLNPCYLMVTIGKNAYQISSYDGTQPANGIKCEIINISETFDSNSEREHFINYQITLQETQ